MRILAALGFVMLICGAAFSQTGEPLLTSNIEDFRSLLNKTPETANSDNWARLRQAAENSLSANDLRTASLQARKSILIAEKLNDDLQIARSYHQDGRVQIRQLDLAGAAGSFEISAIHFAKTERNPDNRLEAAFLLIDWAFIYANPEFISNEKDLEKALFLLAQAEGVGSSIQDTRGISLKRLASLRIAVCLGISGHRPAQILRLEKLLAEDQTDLQRDPLLFEIYLGLQSAYRAIGSYEDAASYLSLLDQLLTRNPDPRKRLVFLREITDFYTQISFFQKRTKTLDEGILLARQQGDSNRLGQFYSARLLTFLEDREFAGARKYLLLLEELAKVDPFAVNQVDILVGKAVIAGLDGDVEKSHEHFAAAETLVAATGNEWTNRLFLCIWQTRLAVFRKDFQNANQIAENYLRLALERSNRDSLPIIYNFLAQASEGLGDTAAAKANSRLAISFVESKRMVRSAPVSLGIFESLTESYQRLISLYLNDGQIEQAFSVSEQLKARWLGEKITGNPAKKKVVIDRTLERSIVEASEEMLRSPADPLLKAKLTELEQRSIFAETEPDRRVPTDSAKNVEPDSLNESLILSPIGSKTAVISYVFTADDQLQAFVWYRGKRIFSRKLALNRTEADELARQTRDKIRGFLFFKQDGKKIFDLFLKPLEIPAEIEHLVIVPDRSIWQIPFQAISNDGRSYLIEKKQISYAPSVSILLEQLRHPEPQRKSFQVFANAEYENFFLKHVDTEAADLAKLFKGQVYFKAGIKDFLKTADQSDIVHFSMHAELDPAEPFRSFLAFQPTDVNRGRLTVEDLLNIPLRTGSMAFLASCETGKVMTGEGLVSLSWAMMGSGASTVISAQWEANDRSTGVFTRTFYRNLQKGLSAAEALRRTSEEMIKSGNSTLSEPYYWAEFSLSGDYR